MDFKTLNFIEMSQKISHNNEYINILNQIILAHEIFEEKKIDQRICMDNLSLIKDKNGLLKVLILPLPNELMGKIKYSKLFAQATKNTFSIDIGIIAYYLIYNEVFPSIEEMINKIEKDTKCLLRKDFLIKCLRGDFKSASDMKSDTYLKDNEDSDTDSEDSDMESEDSNVEPEVLEEKFKCKCEDDDEDENGHEENSSNVILACGHSLCLNCLMNMRYNVEIMKAKDILFSCKECSKELKKKYKPSKLFIIP